MSCSNTGIYSKSNSYSVGREGTKKLQKLVSVHSFLFSLHSSDPTKVYFHWYSNFSPCIPVPSSLYMTRAWWTVHIKTFSHRCCFRLQKLSVLLAKLSWCCQLTQLGLCEQTQNTPNSSNLLLVLCHQKVMIRIGEVSSHWPDDFQRHKKLSKGHEQWYDSLLEIPTFCFDKHWWKQKFILLLMVEKKKRRKWNPCFLSFFSH